MASSSEWPSSKPSKPPAPVFYVPIKPCLRLPEGQSEFLHFLWSGFSSFFMLVRVVGWIFRFVHNCSKDRDHRRFDLLDYDEVVASKHLIYKLSQQEFFPEVFLAIQQSKNLPRGHTLSKFIVTLLPHGHLLVCSRVRDPEAPTSPMKLTVLSPKSKLTKLLVTTLHRTYQHAGITAMSSILANSYYIPSLRNLLKLISRTCVSCQRAYARPLQHIMGMLPSSRTTPAPPFHRTGVDFSGPFLLRLGRTHKPSYVKTYAVVFVCLTTKAIHLDLCSSLSTEDFLASLHRFISRRGCPAEIYSDNGTNFQGAREEIRELQKFSRSKKTSEAIQQFSTHNQINWHHIPPRAPHFGGLWEAAVNSMKTLLRKTLKPHAFFDGMSSTPSLPKPRQS